MSESWYSKGMLVSRDLYGIRLDEDTDDDFLTLNSSCVLQVPSRLSAFSHNVLADLALHMMTPIAHGAGFSVDVGADDAPFNVLLTTYTLFERDSEENKLDRAFLKLWRWSCLLLDEAHAVKNRNAKRTTQLNRSSSCWAPVLMQMQKKGHLLSCKCRRM